MDSVTALEIGQEAIMVMIKASAPILIIALVVGLIISLFQALTQIQEQTLSFVPKIIAVFFSLILLLPYIGGELSVFSEHLATMIVDGQIN